MNNDHIKKYLHYPPLTKNETIEYDKLQYTEESLYSITAHYYNQLICKQILLKCSNNIIVLDATANCGSDTIGFARQFKQVISIEKNQENFNALKHNVFN